MICFAQKAFILKKERVLLIKKGKNDPHQAGKWEVPGGRIQFGEEVDDHIKREVKEEVGLTVDVGQPFHVWQWHNNLILENIQVKRQIIAVARVCHYVSGEVSFENNEPDDYLSGQYCWASPNEILTFDLIENMIPCVNYFIKLYGTSCGKLC